MTARLVIPGRLPGLNEYVESERAHRQKGAALKRECEQTIMLLARSQLRGVRFAGPVRMRYTWYEKDRRRDKDNIAFAKKFVQDALVKAKILENDGWEQIVGFEDRIRVDSKNPRLEITLREVKPLTIPQRTVLFAYASCNMNVSQTARESHYAGSTVRGILDAIGRKTGLNPREFFDLSELVECYLGEFEKGEKIL